MRDVWKLIDWLGESLEELQPSRREEPTRQPDEAAKQG
jgi:hypothetical protein